MTEHVHRWAMTYDGAICNSDCDAELNLREIERRLNATERLSAKDALALNDACGSPLLRTYATELEGENEA